MNKVLVTGANGFVSYYLIRQLLHQGYSIIGTGLGNNRLPFTADNFEYRELDITNRESVITVLQQYKPQFIVHTAAISKPDECEKDHQLAYQINVQGTINLLEEAERIGAFFIYLSKDFVFDGLKGMYRENDPLGPVNYYGVTKQLAEEKVRMSQLKWAIVRTVLVYGMSYSGKDNIVTSVAKSLQNGKPLNIYNDEVRTPTFVEDLASGITAIIGREAAGIFHLSGADIYTPYQIACAVAEYLQLDQALIKPVTRETFEQPALRPLKTGFDLTKAKEQLGYQPISFPEGLKRTLDQLTHHQNIHASL